MSKNKKKRKKRSSTGSIPAPAPGGSAQQIATASAPGNQNNTFGGLLGGRNSYSGERVNSLTALELPAFYAATEILSQSGGRVPIELSDVQSDGRTVPRTTDERYGLVAISPHEDQTAVEMWAQIIANCSVYRNGYVEIKRDGASGMPVELKPLLASDTYPEAIPNKSTAGGLGFKTLRYRTFDPDTGDWRPISRANMIHIRGLNIDGIHGIELSERQKDSIGVAVSRRKFASYFFKNGGRIGGRLRIPKHWTKEEKEALQQDWALMYDNPEALFRTIMMRNQEGLEYDEQESKSFVDTQILEGQEFDVREMARINNIPPHMLGDMTAANYNTLEQQQAAFYAQSLSNWTSRIAQQCFLRLLTREEQLGGKLVFTHKLDTLDYADSSVTAEVASKLTVSGIITPNEGRALFDYAPLPDGDSLLIPPGNQQTGETEETEQTEDSELDNAESTQ